MANDREVHVYLFPQTVPRERLAGSVAVVVDVLRASTTIVYALAAGCCDVRPCAEIDEARALADGMRAGRVLLAGERDGTPIPGFDLGNSPGEFTAQNCRDSTVVLTTTNGTRALLHATAADRVLVAGFVNYSAVCEQLRRDARPVCVLCAGNDGGLALEDTLLAGAFVDFLCEESEARVDDAARLAWDCFENHRELLLGSLEISDSGDRLRQLGYHEDIRLAAQVDQFLLVPELRRDPLRVEVGAVGVINKYWPK
jgi:2-phosphosulfolactate phosphatase